MMNLMMIIHLNMMKKERRKKEKEKKERIEMIPRQLQINAQVTNMKKVNMRRKKKTKIVMSARIIIVKANHLIKK